ncbi:MAG: ORF6N domain-containing protein [Bacteriovoracales bacterium]
MSEVTIKNIESKIYIIRGQKVMLDSDLANLYGVEVKRLNEQVKRNIERFPEDFMFQCESRELEDLRSQFATTESADFWNYKRRTMPYLFTENGVAMLSSVINSKQAIQINIAIMRIFTKLRSFLLLEKDLSNKVDRLEMGTNHLFKVVFERLDNIEDIVTPKLEPKRKKIGLKN